MLRSINKAVIGSIFLFFLAGCATFKENRNYVTKSAMGSEKLNSQSSYSDHDSFIVNLLEKYPDFFEEVIKNKEKLNVQVIYTQINRGKKGRVTFSDHAYNLHPEKYFYPASTVKLPIAILALQKLNELKIIGLDKNTTMITEAGSNSQTEVYNDPTSADGRPTIAHYIKKILLVSDNDAFNRLYEFLGQEYINSTLQAMGYTQTQIIHRLSISLSDEENRATNPVKFMDSTGKIIYQQPLEKSAFAYAARDTKLGKGFMSGGRLINKPFDFSRKNRLLLSDLHMILRSVIFPGTMPKKQQFNLSKDDYAFLRKYMSMEPPESAFPEYDQAEYWDTYVKFLFYGSEKGASEKGIRIFNKVGDAYGFLTDAAYIIDLKKKVEFMVSATIYTNSDEIFNDDTYEYEKTGFPFLKNLGRVLYEYEIKHPKKNEPDLSSFQFSYQE